MLTPAVISTVLALAPPTDLAPPDFSVQLDSVEFIDGGEDVQLVAYDAGGEVIGSIAFWASEDGAVWVVSDYADGYTVVAISPAGDVRTESTLSPDVTAARAIVIGERIDPDSVQEGKGACALSAAGTVISCAAASWWCPFTAISTACNCLPLIVKEWEGKKCPGFG
jgi:hypothetical protein